MKQTVYVDVLLATNIFINYFLLLAVGKFIRICYKRVRLVLASCLGAAYSLIIFLPQMNPWLSLFIKLLMSATIILAAFRITGPKSFFRAIACFYLTSFAFAGLMLALWYFFAPQGMAMKNSVVYFNISPLLLVITTIVCYFAVRLINRLTGKQEVKTDFCKLIITANGSTVECIAKVDTGSSLIEPFSHYPVVVAEYEKIYQAVPDQVRDMMCVTAGGGYSSYVGLRMVPFHALSGEGVLPAFQPERFIIHTHKKDIETDKVYVAVYRGKLGGGAFDALVNPELLSQGDLTEQHEKSK